MIFLVSLAALGACAKIALNSAQNQLNTASMQIQSLRGGANPHSTTSPYSGDEELSRQYLNLRKELSRVDVDTSTWTRGARVVDGGVTPGTFIAVFDSRGRYQGNCSIFQGYVTDENGMIIGFEVQVRNIIYENALSRHTLFPLGNGINDAGEYFVVMSRGQPIEI